MGGGHGVHHVALWHGSGHEVKVATLYKGMKK